MLRSLRYTLALTILIVIPGCGVVVGLLAIRAFRETGSSELKAFASEKELLDYFKDQIGARNSLLSGFDRFAFDDSIFDGGLLTSPSFDADSSVGDTSPTATETSEEVPGFSETTLQEVGVDEADVVKTDGSYLYIIDSRFDGSSLLRIVSITQPDQLELMGEVALEGRGRDIYLHGDKVIALTAGGGFYATVFVEDPAASDGTAVDSGGTDSSSEVTDDSLGVTVGPSPGTVEYVYQRPFTVVTVVDVSDPSAPSVSSETQFDGSQASSRLIDGVLHMVIANYQDFYYNVLPILWEAEPDLSDIKVEELLPDFRRVAADGSVVSGDLVGWETVYRPTDPDGFGVVTLVSVDIDNDAAFTSVGVIAEPGLIYSSLNALYLTDTNYDFSGTQRTTTDVYKFAYVDRGAVPVATGSVPGRVLNQYSMGEHKGNLRVATTIDRTFSFGPSGFAGSTESQNNVYVLAEEDGSLAIIGRVENIAPGETLQSARFVGDRGYLVTFLQIDPLFTLDLANPRAPRVVGELQVPGFSTFLVSMDEDHILAVGQHVPPPGEFGPWAVQVSIFDVTDFANPTRSAHVVIGSDFGASSEALRNPKAFTYYPEQEMLALPVSIFGGFFFEGGIDDGVDVTADEPVTIDSDDLTVDADASPPDGAFEGVIIFHASAAGGLSEMGRISTTFEEAGFYTPSFRRGVFVGEKVYAVTNLGVRGAATANLSAGGDELFLGLPDGAGAGPIVIEPLAESLGDREGTTDSSDGVGG